MTVPLTVLAVLSAIGGYIGLPKALGGANRIEHFLEPVMGTGPGKLIGKGEHLAQEAAAHGAHHPSLAWEYLLMLLSVAIVFIGIWLAYTLYVRQRQRPALLAERFSRFYRILYNKWYVDELYGLIAVRPLHRASLFLWKGIEVLIKGSTAGSITRFCFFQRWA